MIADQHPMAVISKNICVGLLDGDDDDDDKGNNEPTIKCNGMGRVEVQIFSK